MDLLKQISVAIVISCLVISLTDAAAVQCVIERQENVTACIISMGTNIRPFVKPEPNVTGFLDELCSSEKSFPFLECVHKYSKGCPELLDLILVQEKQFGPYHLADIAYFDNARHYCDCTGNIGCVEEVLSIQQSTSFQETTPTTLSPWKSMPNYTSICDESNRSKIQCAASGLARCKAGITAKYSDRFTGDDADQVAALGAFIGAHCSQVTSPDFSSTYSCVESQAKSVDMQTCFGNMDQIEESKKPCVQRNCIHTTMGETCEEDWVAFFIDAINIYGSVQVPKLECSSGAITVATRNMFTVTVLALVLRIL